MWKKPGRHFSAASGPRTNTVLQAAAGSGSGKPCLACVSWPGAEGTSRGASERADWTV